MQEAALNRGTSDKRGAIVVAARLLDRRCSTLSPYAIRSIDYSLYEVDVDGACGVRPVAGFDRTTLDVDDVMFAELQNEAWAVDDVGYNFRHKIALARTNDTFAWSGTRYEIRYVFTHQTGEATVVCFRIRRVSL